VRVEVQEEAVRGSTTSAGRSHAPIARRSPAAHSCPQHPSGLAPSARWSSLTECPLHARLETGVDLSFFLSFFRGSRLPLQLLRRRLSPLPSRPLGSGTAHPRRPSRQAHSSGRCPRAGRSIRPAMTAPPAAAPWRPHPRHASGMYPGSRRQGWADTGPQLRARAAAGQRAHSAPAPPPPPHRLQGRGEQTAGRLASAASTSRRACPPPGLLPSAAASSPPRPLSARPHPPPSRSLWVAPACLAAERARRSRPACRHARRPPPTSPPRP
jgi:hypothetical protein